MSKILSGMTCPRLAIALGDPAGIGTEVVLKALVDPAVTAGCKVTLVGTRSLLGRLGLDLKLTTSSESWLDVALEAELEQQIVVGAENAAGGEASFRYLEMAIAQTLAGKFDGVVTAPISKFAWKAAGHLYPGQTELLAKRAGAEQFGMLFVARSPHTGWALRALLATTHIPLRQVPDALTPELMSHKLALLVDCLRQEFGLETPRIAIAGLNPHSGEQGQLGREELDWLTPWVTTMRDRYPQVQLDGPIPPDTLWVRPGQAWFGSTSQFSASAPPAHDAYLALYHDQGLIPIKLMAFDRAVNATIGLPFVRTSPDHGTAYDIAGLGVADASSMSAAIKLASQLARQRLQTRVK